MTKLAQRSKSGANLLYGPAMPQTKEEMSDPLYHLPSKKREGSNFSCSMCDKNYAYRQRLVNHMNKAHGIIQKIVEDNSTNDSFNVSGQCEVNYSENFMIEMNLAEIVSRKLSVTALKRKTLYVEQSQRAVCLVCVVLVRMRKTRKCL